MQTPYIVSQSFYVCILHEIGILSGFFAGSPTHERVCQNFDIFPLEMIDYFLELIYLYFFHKNNYLFIFLKMIIYSYDFLFI